MSDSLCYPDPHELLYSLGLIYVFTHVLDLHISAPSQSIVVDYRLYSYNRYYRKLWIFFKYFVVCYMSLRGCSFKSFLCTMGKKILYPNSFPLANQLNPKTGLQHPCLNKL